MDWKTSMEQAWCHRIVVAKAGVAEGAVVVASQGVEKQASSLVVLISRASIRCLLPVS
jgi:hypothetical protein